MTHVLVTLAHDGKVELFSEKDVQVLVLNLPRTRDVQEEIDAEELLDTVLPRSFKDVYWPGMLRGSGWWKVLRPSRIDNDLNYVDAWHGLSELNNKRTPHHNRRMLEVLKG